MLHSFFNDTATTEIYTLSLHDALPICEEWVKRNFTPEAKARAAKMVDNLVSALRDRIKQLDWMSEPTKVQAVAKLDAFLRKVDRKSTRLNSSHPSISYAVFCLKKKKTK